MGAVSAFLLTLTLSAGESLTAEELQIAVAAMKENLGSLQSIEARYRVRSEFKAGYVPPHWVKLSDPSKITWVWSPTTELILTSSHKTPDQWREQFLYDGARSYEWRYASDEPERPELVNIMPGVIILDWVLSNYLPYAIGVRVPHADGDLPTLIDSARNAGSLAGTRKDGVWTISLETPFDDQVARRFELDLDPAQDYRLAAIRRFENFLDATDQQRSIEFAVVEFQSVLDEASGRQRWFPLTVDYILPNQTITLTVESVRINHRIPEDRLTFHEPPFGTEIHEVSAPGEPMNVYVIGGNAAVVQQAAERARRAQEEHDRQEIEQPPADASPTERSFAFYAGLFGAAGLIVAALALCRPPKRE